MSDAAQAPQKIITPREVLYDEMVFFRDKAIILGNKIASLLRAEGTPRGVELFQLFKLMVENKERLVDIATKLAPYEHAKLASLDVKQETTVNFVIRAPAVVANTNDWIAMTDGAGKNNIIENDNVHRKQISIDATILDDDDDDRFEDD